MKTKREKEFNAVEFQRSRRKELSELYSSDTNEFWKQLKKIQKKYRNKFRQKEKHFA